MAKHLVIDEKINSCEECPYHQYDADYGRSYDSGYDCCHFDIGRKRIADDKDIREYRLDMQYYNLRPILKNNLPKPIDPLQPPSWCPLKDCVEQS